MSNILDVEVFDTSLIGDSVLLDRVLEYKQKYHRIKNTNCSTFTRFLYDGVLVEITPENNYFAFEEDLEIYSDQNVNVGDVLCFLYNKFDRKAKDFFNDKKTRDLYVKTSFCPNGEPTVLSSHIRNYYKKCEYFNDFHFMVCVNTQDGKHVFISQLGRSFVSGPINPNAELGYITDSLDGFLRLPIVVLFKKRKETETCSI